MTNRGMVVRRRCRLARLLGWGGAALVLALPRLAEAPWTASDYALAAVLLGGTGLALELVIHRFASTPYRVGAALGLAAGLLTIWVNAAVGLFGPEDDPANASVIAVLVVATVGALLARFEAAGLSRAMLAAAVAQTAASLVGAYTDLRGALFSLAFAGLWLGAAAGFRKAARDSRRRGRTAC